MDYEDLKKYEFARIGAEALRAKNIPAARASLDKIVGNLTLDKDKEILYKGVKHNDESVAIVLDGFEKERVKVYDKATITDFWELYNGVFNKNEKIVYGAGIEKYKGKKLKDLEEELKEKGKTLSDVLDGKKKLSESEISKLKTDVRKYNEVLSVIGVSEQIRYSEMNLEVANSVNKTEKQRAKEQLRGMIGAG